MNYIIQRLEKERVAETWIGWDNLTVLMQLGLYPPSNEAPKAPRAGER